MKKIFIIILLLIVLSLKAQSTFSFGWLPKVTFSNRISSSIKWVNSIEAREDLYKDTFMFSHHLVDVSSIISIKTNVYQSFNLGYIIRIEGDEIIHRLLQHFNMVQNLDGLKIGHRLGMEQFFQNTVKPQYRTRYRATFEKPLKGLKVDVKEWYLKISNEYLYQFNEKDLEARISPYLGYKLSKRDKIEIGLDYRLGSLLELEKKNNLWFRTTWYISI
ncbi:hypothetical protein BTO06_02025 [Tenacibaculum sp. SZ-18]|uniref:DUF2490 domain-containing protein n=1 Tax=Tenacibaculum sp. SZ-18 TaxID=754423 RepID=UPI000CA09FF0|nr:DUF2490 domain-containing protein [Tenacibaculum sp. SZ-18]AUC14007.1 hypothetical protein BTO06_02025 [Tenacibaculum sp. SZ-18]